MGFLQDFRKRSAEKRLQRMERDENFRFLRKSGLFRNIGPEAFLFLANHAVERAYREGELVCKQGNPGMCTYLIKRGEVEISYTSQGHKMSCAKAKQGELFGEISLITGSERTATVKAVDNDTVLLALSIFDFATFQEQFPEDAVIIAKDLVDTIIPKLLASAQSYHKVRQELEDLKFEAAEDMGSGIYITSIPEDEKDKEIEELWGQTIVQGVNGIEVDEDSLAGFNVDAMRGGPSKKKPKKKVKDTVVDGNGSVELKPTIDIEEMRKILRKQKVFRTIKANALSFFLSSLKSFIYPADTLVPHSGDHALYFVTQGDLAMSLACDQGEEIICGEIKENDLFGEMEDIYHSEHHASVKTLEPTEILGLSKDALQQFKQRYPQAWVAIMDEVMSTIIRNWTEVTTKQQTVETAAMLVREERGELA